MIPAEPSSGKAANTETLRGQINLRFQSGNSIQVSDVRLARAEWEALTALLADYEAVTAENRRLSALNERMREWILEKAEHVVGDDEFYCRAGEFTRGLDAEGNAETYGCNCGLDALRATLVGESLLMRGEKHE